MRWKMAWVVTECNGTMGWAMKYSFTGCLWEEDLWEDYSR